MKALLAADLFCGAGGSSTGLHQACERLDRQLRLAAVNHWSRAVETHAQNHPRAAHFCEDLTTLDPRKAVPGGKLDILVASPECTHHSVARGGKPINDQSRASAWCVLRWATALTIDRILIENVPEFQTWGPIGSTGRPLASKKGETFGAFIRSLESLGYRVEWRILNAADHGGATTRRRLFVQAARGRRKIHWPDPTHEPNPRPGLFGQRQRWREAREVIDWSIPSESIFNRKRPLSPNTIERIKAGLIMFGGKAAEPFLYLLTHGGRSLPINEPIATLTASRELYLVEPFLMSFNGKPEEGRRRHSLDKPLPTQHCSNRFGLCEPFILPHRQFDGMQVDDISNPLRTITATNGGCNALVEPFLVPFYANGQADSITDPLRTVTTKDRHALVEPDRARLDIRFRMLQPHELASAMGFPAGYRITGNRSEQVRQVGNAVEVNTARELCRAMLEN